MKIWIYLLTRHTIRKIRKSRILTPVGYGTFKVEIVISVLNNPDNGTHLIVE